MLLDFRAEAFGVPARTSALPLDCPTVLMDLLKAVDAGLMAAVLRMLENIVYGCLI